MVELLELVESSQVMRECFSLGIQAIVNQEITGFMTKKVEEAMVHDGEMTLQELCAEIPDEFVTYMQ